MQSLFPMTSVGEMRGHQFSDLSNKEVWHQVTTRIKADKKYSSFLRNYKDFNIADVANALSYFQKHKFQVTDTPFDKYMKGNVKILTLKEKKGAKLFFTKARCASCHGGPLLSNLALQNIAIPQVSPSSQPAQDLGFSVQRPNRTFSYLFLNQPLRNIALTAPFMHNGAFTNLKQVIEHYNNTEEGLLNFRLNKFKKKFDPLYSDKFIIDKDNNDTILNSIPPIIRQPLGLSAEEKLELECFLKKSLTQQKWHKTLNFTSCKS